jgi:3'-phosphoadenosine 5'-phosphosulfate sulfotransferase (PAPS reductase)/FAD synthetase
MNNRIIVAISGGIASAYCADWAIKEYGKENVLLYFNDTKWEDYDLYRFLKELSEYWGIPITNDSDGRSPEELFFDKEYLGNSRVGICSIELKAKRLQRFFEKDDTLVFGIGLDEVHRAIRIAGMYNEISNKKYGVDANIVFPLIQETVSKEYMQEWLNSIGVERPRLYDLGFTHNNCSGGCVRGGKKHWKHLLETLPDVYKSREDMEERFRAEFGKDVTILKDITLKEFREKLQSNYKFDFSLDTDNAPVECIGGCARYN